MPVPKEEIIDKQLGDRKQLMKLLVIMYNNSRPKTRANPWLGFTISNIQKSFREFYGVKLGCTSTTTGLEIAILTLRGMGLVMVVSPNDANEAYYDLKEVGVEWGSKIYYSALKGDPRFAACIARSQNPTARFLTPMFMPALTA